MDERQLIDYLSSTEIRDFIRVNEHTPVEKLLLNPPELIRGHEKYVADQLISRKKARSKLPSWYENKKVIYPSPVSVEQSSSEITANHKSSLLSTSGEGPIYDLTGGMGVDTLAFRGKITYVEQDKWLCRVFAHNSSVFNREIEIIQDPAESFLASFSGRANFYLDPARRDQTHSKVFRFDDCSPRLSELLPFLLEKATNVWIKASPMIDLKKGVEELDSVRGIHVISVKNEVKEVLFHLEQGWNEDPIIHCRDLGENWEDFSFTFREEANAERVIAETGDLLLDPGSAILKAGAFNLIARRFPVKKVAINTHLYTSQNVISGFPGRQFMIIGDGKEVKKYAENGRINVITKNYPIRPEALKKQLKVKDGGDHFLIGFRDLTNKPRLVIALLVSNV